MTLGPVDGLPLLTAFLVSYLERDSIGSARPTQRRNVPMQRKTDRDPPIPAAARPVHDAIVALTDAFCREQLNTEYQSLCRKLAATRARKRPSPLTRGKP